MDPSRDQLRGWFEGEPSLVEPRMREIEDGAATHDRLRDQKIEIEDSRSPPLFLRPIATGRPFELMASIEQGPRSRGPGEHCRGVEEIGLRWANRACAPQRRHRQDLSGTGQGRKRFRKGRFGLAEVSAKTDQDLHLSG